MQTATWPEHFLNGAWSEAGSPSPAANCYSGDSRLVSSQELAGAGQHHPVQAVLSLFAQVSSTLSKPRRSNSSNIQWRLQAGGCAAPCAPWLEPGRSGSVLLSVNPCPKHSSLPAVPQRLLDLLCCLRLSQGPASHALFPQGASVHQALGVRAAQLRPVDPLGSSPCPWPLLQQDSSSSCLTQCTGAPTMAFDRARGLSRGGTLTNMNNNSWNFFAGDWAQLKAKCHTAAQAALLQWKYYTVIWWRQLISLGKWSLGVDVY